MKLIIPALYLMLLLTEACTNKSAQSSVNQDSLAAAYQQYLIDSLSAEEDMMMPVDTLMNGDGPATWDEKEQQIVIQNNTRLRYPSFTLVIHDFKGYYLEEKGGKRTCGLIESGTAVLNESEKFLNINGEEEENPDYLETLIVKKDTITLSEELDNYLDGNMVEVIPANRNDNFKLYFAALNGLSEVMDYRNKSEKEIEKFSARAQHFNEPSKYSEISDSALLFFRLGKDFSTLYEDEVKRIKAKYKLKDTLVVIPGEYDTRIELSKNGKLYAIQYGEYLFKIERYHDNKLVEVKFIMVYQPSGC